MEGGRTVAQALATIRERLRAAGVPAPEVDAELLVRHVLGWSRARLVAEGRAGLDEHVNEQLERLVRRRARREPLQLIVGSVGFRHLEIDVRSGVFIPRPETEVLAGLAVERTPVRGIVVEPCTGAGAVACAVATEAEPAQVVATDRSAAAVRLARHNAARCGAAVTVLRGDLLEPASRGLLGRVDVLVSNPPYLAAADLAAVEPEVGDWDPRDALVAGPTGHEVSDRLVAAAGHWLRPGGWLLLEVAEARAGDTAARCEAAGLTASDVVADLSGRDRIVAARRPA